jgi:hypothetical protein
MNATITKRTILFVFILALLFSCKKPVPITEWERKCAACHDGQTVLNEKVVPGKEQLKAKYPTLEAFINSCDKSPFCMNILKHNKKLFKQVGKELGLKSTAQK